MYSKQGLQHTKGHHLGHGRRHPKRTEPVARRMPRGSSRAATRGFSLPSHSTERKFKDTSIEVEGNTSTPGSLLLNAVAQGNTISERTGSHIQLRKCMLKGWMFPVDASTSNTKAVLLIVYDKQTNKTAMQLTDLLESGNDVNSWNKLENRDRFTVLKRIEYVLGAENSTISPNPSGFLINEYIDINLPTHFDGATGGIGEITTGSLYMFILGDTPATQGANFNVNVRLRYDDQ